MSATCNSKRPLQGFAHGAKGELVPGHLVLVEQPGLDRLRPRIEVCVLQPRTIEQVHLPDTHHVEQREQALQLDARAGFFHRLAHGTFGRGLAQFHEPGRQRPVAVARLDVALAQQHLFAPHRHRADHVERVLVVHFAAGAAHRALAVVIGRRAVVGGRAADAAMFDAAQVEHPRQFSRQPCVASSPGLCSNAQEDPQ
jgi:hypothetical protein